MTTPHPHVAIVDYGLGNLYSVDKACRAVGMETEITSLPDRVAAADAVLLPGVGAFGDAMAALRDRGLVQVLRDLAASGKPLVGICLGLQLLMSESHEFGFHKGLDLVAGSVERLPDNTPERLKVPQVSWRPILPGPGADWSGSALEDIPPGTHFYFVHSYYVKPAEPGVAFSVTPFGGMEFCSSIRKGNIFACQFHPERSASQGLRIYRNIARLLAQGDLS